MVFQKLHAWQADNGFSDSKLASEIGVDQSAISRAKRGLRVLRMDNQLAIQKLTKVVSPADWAEFYAQTAHLRPAKASHSKKNDRAPTAEAA